MSEKKTNRLKTVGLVVIITFLGKVLGLVRDMLQGHHFATGRESTAFLTASQIPRNFFDAVFASAISSSFIPIFNEILEKQGKDEAFKLTRSFFTLMGLLTLALSGVGIVFAPQLTTLFAEGFDAETASLCTRLLCILFPTVFFTGIAFSMVGVLQSLGEFNVPAALSIVSNGIIIIYYLFFCDRFGIYGLAVAFLIGWAMQALMQIPSLHRFGFRYAPSLWHPGIRSIFALMLPVMVSTWIQPINQAVSTRFGSYLFEGAGVSAINYANSIFTVVAGILVLSITNVIFPEMSRLSTLNKIQELQELVRSSLRNVLFLLLPMTVGMMLLATPLIQLLYEHGVWDDFSTRITSRALIFLSVGMIGYGVQNVLVRVFYAEKNGKAPLITGIVSILLNLVLCIVLSPVLDVGGLALASALSTTVSALLLLVFMIKRNKGMFDLAFWGALARMVCCTAIMGVIVAVVKAVCISLLPETVIGRCVLLAVCAVAGIVSYFGAALLFRLEELSLVRGIIARFVGK